MFLIYEYAYKGHAQCSSSIKTIKNMTDIKGLLFLTTLNYMANMAPTTSTTPDVTTTTDDLLMARLPEELITPNNKVLIRFLGFL